MQDRCELAPLVRGPWIAGCRRLNRRYERKAEDFLAFVGVATALIWHRRLAKT